MLAQARSRRALLALGCAAAVVGAAPAAAPAATTFRDRVLDAPVAGKAAFNIRRTYRAADGTAVQVRLSEDVPNGEAVAQGIVGFLGTRLHGAELSRLVAVIGTPPQINAACGGEDGVLACYVPRYRTMYVPYRDPGRGGPYTRDYAITHEYGHHIATYRSNAPFSALGWGAKYWSSYEHVCAGVFDGLFYPGDQGEHYLDDPGEAFADAYAHMHYPDVPWQFNPRLAPDAGALEALRRDVVSPWRGSRRRVVAGALNRAHQRFRVPLRSTLDGTVDLQLRGPRGANFDLRVYDGGRLIGRTRVGGSRDHLRLLACRENIPVATAVIHVVRRAGAGRFTLTVLYPG
jgi:hypothetical protein